jgi:hypothetical protein
VGQQPADADSRGIADFLVRLQRHDNVALRRVALLFVADQVSDEGCRHELVVGCAAAVEVAFPLGELEGVKRPVLAPRVDHRRHGPRPRAAHAHCDVANDATSVGTRYFCRQLLI